MPKLIALLLFSTTLLLSSSSFTQLLAEEKLPEAQSSANSTPEASTPNRPAQVNSPESSPSTTLPVSKTKSFTRVDALVASLTIFVLAIFIGFELITKVPPTLHTPLMSGSNAISGISIVGALFAAGTEHHGFAAFLGFIAVVLATLNAVGGYWVTHRMLDMFKPKKR